MTKRNTNAAEILLFLHKIVEVFTEYFKELEEESIRDNFVIIYELLDEMMDFGYPQTTESKILQECAFLSLERALCETSHIDLFGFLDILRKNHTNWKYKRDRLLLSPMLYLGEAKVFVTARMRFSWT